MYYHQAHVFRNSMEIGHTLNQSCTIHSHKTTWWRQDTEILSALRALCEVDSLNNRHKSCGPWTFSLFLACSSHWLNCQVDCDWDAMTLNKWENKNTTSIFDCIYYCCDINLLSRCHIYFLYRIELFCTCLYCSKRDEHSGALIVTKTTKTHALYTVYKYFSPSCIHRHGTTCQTSARRTNSRTATVPEKTLDFGQSQQP